MAIFSLSCRLSARRGSADRFGSKPLFARIIFLAMMLGFTSAKLPLCSSGCGNCPAQVTLVGVDRTFKKTAYYSTCSACSNVASDGEMFVYQGYSGTSGSNSYLWFDCSGGGGPGR